MEIVFIALIIIFIVGLGAYFFIAHLNHVNNRPDYTRDPDDVPLIRHLIDRSYDSEGYDSEGYNKEGYNKDGFDRNGYYKFGFKENNKSKNA